MAEEREPADEIWSLHARLHLLYSKSVNDQQIVSVLRIAEEAIAVAGGMADKKNLGLRK